ASSSWADLGPLAMPNVTLSELDQTAALGASFVTRRWRGVTSLRVAAEVERTDFAAIPDTSLATVCAGCGRQDLYGGSATLTLSRLVTGALSVSPEDAFAWSGTYRRREERGTTRWSNELRSRLALYAHVPDVGGFAHHVLALRLFAGATNGPVHGTGGRGRRYGELRLPVVRATRRRRATRQPAVRRRATTPGIRGTRFRLLDF